MPPGSHSSSSSRGGGGRSGDTGGAGESRSTAADRRGTSKRSQSNLGGEFGSFEGESRDTGQADVARSRELSQEQAAQAEADAAAAVERDRVATEQATTREVMSRFSKLDFDAAVAFSEFSAATDEGLESLGQFFGFAPEASALAKLGAQKADPAAFGRGQGTALGIEMVGVTASAIGLPARLGVAAVDRAIESFSDPAFSLGMQSIDVDSTLGTVAGLGMQFAGFGPSAAKAVSAGINLAGIAVEGADLGLTDTSNLGEATFGEVDVNAGNQGLGGAGGGDVVTERQEGTAEPREQAVAEAIGARVSGGRGELASQGRSRARAQRRGRGALRVRRA